MESIYKLLEYIRAVECKKRLVVSRNKKLGNITRTVEIVSHKPVVTDGISKTFKPDVTGKILLMAMLLPAWTIMLGLLIRRSDSFNLAIAFAVVVYCLIMGVLVWRAFFSKRLNYRITLSAAGLSINDLLHRWQDIKETAILDLPIGKHGSRYLVIVFLDDSYEVRELSNFNGLWYPFHQKLARYIEYFKARQS